MESENDVNVSDELIVKYLSGEASPDEALKLMDWINQPENLLHFKQFESAWNIVRQEQVPTFNPDAAWNKFQNTIHAPAKSKEGRIRSIFSPRTLLIAASLFIAVASSVLVFVKYQGEEVRETLATRAELKVVTLSDQSKVTLFRQSTLN